ncbi:MAG: hypothetical protein M3245_04245, partial [Actinomycetota bacterium]|nr:hypothetical protein [Actinomycetota bacterium]
SPSESPTSSASSSSTVSMSSADREIRISYGQTMVLSGHVSGAAGQTVAVQQALAGGDWQTVARVISRSDGSWRYSGSPVYSGAWRAVLSNGRASASRRVTVAATLGVGATRHVRRNVYITVWGTLSPGVHGRLISLQLRTRQGWSTVSTARTDSGGQFRAYWRTSRAGRYMFRARFAGTRYNAGVTRGVRGLVYVYRPAYASWYGPGFYGRRTACGQRLGRGTLGVAHRRLPCGTSVAFRYGGRSVTAPVIDRGPFIRGREWDLTAELKRRLRFPSTGIVWSAR